MNEHVNQSASGFVLLLKRRQGLELMFLQLSSRFTNCDSPSNPKMATIKPTHLIEWANCR